MSTSVLSESTKHVIYKCLDLGTLMLPLLMEYPLVIMDAMFITWVVFACFTLMCSGCEGVGGLPTITSKTPTSNNNLCMVCLHRMKCYCLCATKQHMFINTNSYNGLNV